MDEIQVKTIKGYEIVERLGAGGFGAVYRARQTTVNREVAIKFIIPRYANEADFIRRFEVEAQIIARLEHPHITPLIDYWRDADGAYLVMRFLRGGSLRDVLDKSAFDLESTSRVLDQIASALAFAHRHDVIHRDIKPGNILLDEDGNAYLADFGIAKDLTVKQSHTQPDAVIGSLDYISPEQARSEPITPRTDIYSLGVMLYEMITGQHPFKNATHVELLYKHINEPLPDIENLPENVRDTINAIIQRATAKDPAQRYEDVLALAIAFRDGIGRGSTTQELLAIEQMTLREHEILQLIVDGLSNKEIAEQLFITVGTVKWHVNQLYNKLGVRNRVQAIIRAREMNLIVHDTDDFSRPEFSSSQLSLPEPENPYKGLHAFQTADSRDFFGREELVEKLLHKMSDKSRFQRFLAVVGPSGSGKSSLVKAGLIPALWKGGLPDSEKWFVVDMMPGTHPLDELEIALTRVAANQVHNLREQLQRDERGLVRAAELILPKDSTELVVVVDQFEELFTLVEDEARRQHFLNLLATAVIDKRSRVRVVVTLRADYYDKPLHYLEFGEMLKAQMETVLPLSAKGLERAIAGPAERVGVAFEPGLVTQMVSEMTYQASALPLLQYALTELFERRQGRLLTHAAYQEMGGAVGALANRAEEIFLSFNQQAQELSRQVFLRLVTLGEGAEDTRRRVERRELLSLTDDADTMEEILDNFAEHRLLALDHDDSNRQPTIEVAHEALIREWERLRAWLNENREDIRQERIVAQAAEAWYSNNRDKSYLLSGSRLEQAEKWRQATDLTLIPREREFIEASITERTVQQKAERERQAREIRLEQRSRNFLRGLVAVFAIATLIAVGLSAFAFNQSKRAEENAARAQNVALVAGSREALAQNNTDLAIALALQAVTLDSNSTRAQLALSESAYTSGTMRRFTGHGDEVNAIDISPDGLTFISGSDDHTLILWDIQTGELLRRFEGHTDVIHCTEFSPDGRTVISGSKDDTAILWDVQTGQIVRRFEDYNSRIYTIAFSTDGQSIIAGGESADSSLIQWDIQSGEVLRRFEGHTAVVEVLELSPDGLTMVSGSADNTMILWDVQTGQIVRRIEAVSESGFDGVKSLTISPDGRTVLGGYTTGGMILWDLSTGELRWRFDTKIFSWVTSVAFSPDGRRVLMSNESMMALWDIETGEPLREYYGEGTGFTTVVLTVDGTHALSGGFDGIPRLWDLEAGQLVRHFADAQNYASWEIDRSPDGRTALSSSTNGTVTLWNVETAQEIYHFTDDQPISTVTYSPDGQSALIGTGYFNAEKIEPGHLILWDVRTGQEIRRFVGHPLTVFDVAFSPDGQTAVSCGGGGVLILWDVATGEVLRRFQGYENDDSANDGGIWSVAFSPDGRTILTSMPDARLILWDVATGEEIRHFIGHAAVAERVIISHNGQMALSAAWDNTAILWDMTTGNIIHRFTEHTGAVYHAQFSPDDRMALTGSADGTSILWDLSSGQPIRRYNDAGFYQAAFSPDGKDAFVGFFNGSLQLWRIDATLDDLLAWVQANRYIPELTCEQRELYQVEPLCEVAE